MTAAATVIHCLLKERTVVVVEHKMFAFVTYDVRNALEIAIVFGYNERAWVESQHHSCGIDEAALIVIASGVLPCRHSNVRRIISLRIAQAVCARYENRVIGIIKM